MKVYLVMDHYYSSKPIHSAYLSKKKAKEKSDELRLQEYIWNILDYMHNAGVSRKEAVEFVDGDFPVLLYCVEELEVEE